jgi:tRNA nucleotidyltransferase/poly(A) polymerase
MAGKENRLSPGGEKMGPGTWFDREGVLDFVRQLLAARSCRGYVVGGYVRDLLLGRETYDLDLVVEDGALVLARETANRLGGSFVLLDQERHTARVVLRGGEQRYYLDFATLRGGTLRSDLGARDFTINAMAIDVQDTARQPEILDLFQGQRDLEDGLVRAVSDSAFVDDSIRLLRAVRFVAELAMEVEEHTQELMVRDGHLIAQASGERVRDELCKILATGSAEGHLRHIHRLGLLVHLVPELEGLRGLDQPLPHYEDVFEHSLHTVGAMDWVCEAVERLASGQELPSDERWGAAGEVHEYFRPSLGPFAEQVAAHLREALVDERSRAVLLKLAALLHDAGKGNTGKVEEDGRIRFFGHDQQGAAVAARVLRRFRFGSREVRLAQTVVRQHMRPLHLAKLEEISDRASHRFFRDTGGAGVDVLLLSLGDNLALVHDGDNLDQWVRICGVVGLLLRDYFERYDQIIEPEPLLSGKDLLERFGMEPGPAVGRMLQALHEAQATGEVSTEEQALHLVEELLGKKEG